MFDESGPEQRRGMTTRLAAEKKSNLDRWRDLSPAQSETWDHRAAWAGQRLNGCLTVVDIGCGHMALERYLLDSTTYIPVDLVQRDARTTVLDLNSAPTDAIKFHGDGVALLGLLEYLYNPIGVLSALSKNFRWGAITYCVTDLIKDEDERASHGWTNHYSKFEIQEIFEKLGWAIVAADQLDNMQVAWKIRMLS